MATIRIVRRLNIAQVLTRLHQAKRLGIKWETSNSDGLSHPLAPGRHSHDAVASYAS